MKVVHFINRATDNALCGMRGKYSALLIAYNIKLVTCKLCLHHIEKHKHKPSPPINFNII